MPITFNGILREAGIQLADVRLLRHKDNRSAQGRSPYELWRDNTPQFEFYQSVQSLHNAPKLKAPLWASFVGTPSDETLFVGLYGVGEHRLLTEDSPKPHMDGVDTAGSCNIYSLTLREQLRDLIGLLLIEWGPGERAWAQRADHQDKRVTELRARFREPEFPGFLDFCASLSQLPKLPQAWIAALKASRGVYVLTCPRTKEQYVGSATGEQGLWGRWQNYVTTGHGDNLGLKSRDPSDYQVSILEVAGTSATPEQIAALEGRWQLKLRSQEMGLNRNLASRPQPCS